MLEAGAAAPPACPSCGTELAPALLACPVCHALVHAPRLKQLAAEAEQAEARGEPAAALAAWRAALELLPPGARQGEAVRARLAALQARAPDVPAAPPAGSRWARWLAPLGVAGLLLWKFKFLVVFALSKLKLLLLGLTKASTFFSMLLAWGVYWTLWGWKFALGFVALMYVHEMGHVAALRRLGIPASAPMFVPGLGAFVRMHQYPQSEREDARVGLAGPLWGLYATVAVWLAHLWSGAPLLAALARSSAWLNLFNLLPLGPLDGGRGFRPLSRPGRWLVVCALAAAWIATHEGLLALLALVGGARAFSRAAPADNDGRSLAEWLLLIAGLSALAAVRVPGLPR